MSTNDFPELLPFDGSYLGEHNFFDVVVWSAPCHYDTPILFALLGKQRCPVVLKRNTSKRSDQVIIDELKPLFGLHKMGSHRIRLCGVPKKYYPDYPWSTTEFMNIYIHCQWSDYFVFQASGKLIEGTVVITPVRTLGETIWAPSSMDQFEQIHWDYYYEIQKIFVFRNLCRVTSKALKDVLVKRDPVRFVSVNETKARDPRTPYKGPMQELSNFLFPKPTSQAEIMIKMLGLEKETYRERLDLLRRAVIGVIERVDSEKLWLSEGIIDQIDDTVTAYYTLAK